MFVIRRISVIGVTTLHVSVETVDIEAFRNECAATFKVSPCDVKFVYDMVE